MAREERDTLPKFNLSAYRSLKTLNTSTALLSEHYIA